MAEVDLGAIKPAASYVEVLAYLMQMSVTLSNKVRHLSCSHKQRQSAFLVFWYAVEGFIRLALLVKTPTQRNRR